ncbi:hypothetical protein CPB85DRAFT_889387 [Mucidula mucida]|nr:hypothetical protein CPB85DRAFT_889387 [Mucidula mucida]
MAFKVQRTYTSKRHRKHVVPPSSPISTLSSSPPPVTTRKRPLQDADADAAPVKRLKKDARKPQEKQKALTQLHFCIDQSTLRQCPKCDLSYTKGAPEDESLHRAHCMRVQRDMEWGREAEREATKARVDEVANNVVLKNGQKGRIICIRGTVGGKIGAKLSTILKIVNTALSSPPIESKMLQVSKAYLFLLPSTSNKEKIVGCVLAQRISSAMAIVSPDATTSTDDLVHVDTSLFCQPEQLPTALGIARIFVTKSIRRQGIASQLLSTAAKSFIEGCELDASKGQVAFTQTTGEGLALMRRWGGNEMRIYEE